MKHDTRKSGPAGGFSRVASRLALASAAFPGAAALAQIGPDLQVGEIHEVLRWGSRDGYQAYSVGTIVCNLGDMIADWNRLTPAHPVIAQNLYRVKDGRLEQIGVSWVKHTFSADIAPLCTTCTIPPGFNGQQLGVGCADAYSAGINGELWTLGPRGPIRASDGVFPYPVDFTGIPSATPTIGRRVQVATGDVDASLNVGARYFAETQFIAADEAAYGNGGNSASYREFAVNASNLNMTPAGPTRRTLPAIHAWKEADPEVTVSSVEVPGDGVLLVGSRATPLGDGRWRYVYSVQNLTSDRAVGSFRVPLSPCATATVGATSLPRYHSGERWANTPWTHALEARSVTWSAPGAWETSPDTSALRWGTVATVEFTINRPPTTGLATLRLFVPGSPEEVAVSAVVPGGSSDFNGDGFADFFDYDGFVAAFELGEAGADFNGDGFLDFFDYDEFVTAFELGC
jgi:hypothetical protein